MRYRSTGGGEAAVGFSEALHRPLAEDGGLWMPERAPRLPAEVWASFRDRSLAEVAAALLAPFAEDELSGEALAGHLVAALDFPGPLVPLGDGLFLLELFHGPTLAFKDFGARTLARLLPATVPPGPELTVLVATSGDTGGAVAAAFHRVPGTRVVVLFPRGRISPRQEAQLSTLGDNVTAVAVGGTFDDCQRLAKEAFADPGLAERHRLTSANSINLGRLLPQMAYYAHAAARLAPGSPAPVFCVPSGNLGNLTAGLLARRMGMPAHRFLAAANANRALPDFLASGRYRPRPTVPTLANAMDVGDPSNLARVRHLFPEVGALREAVAASSHSDAEVEEVIRRVHRERARVLDPHTAVGWRAVERYREAGGGQGRPVVLLATAHPAKFGEVVEPLIGEALPLPPVLAKALARERRAVEIEAELGALAEVLEDARRGGS